MERDWRDFKNIYGGIEGARSAFERACETMLRKMHSGQTVQQIRVKLGDGGIDVYVGELGVEPITVYQCKFFLDDFDSPQQAQIRNSFQTAISSDKFEVKAWVLCIPKVLDINETVWWTKWKSKQIKLHKKDTQFISLLTGNELIDLMKSFGIYEQVFKIEQLNLTREIHSNVTQLVETFNPTKSGLPKIKWSTYVGKQTWKNTPLVIGNSIYVGSAGDKWNTADENDGIYCLNANSGKIEWSYSAEADVNEISYFDGMIVGGTDAGIVHCISAKTGKLKWRSTLSSGIVSKIYKYAGYSQERLIVICYDGTVNFLNLKSGEIFDRIFLEGNVIANAEFIDKHRNRTLYIPTVQGLLYELKEGFDSFHIASKTVVLYPDIHDSHTGFSRAELYSKPLVYDDKIFLGITRQTYYDYPAVICLNELSKEVLWHASDPHKKGGHFGNIRTNLLADGDQIIFTHPYSNELVGLCKSTGQVEWVTNLGRPMFQQWSSPVKADNGYYLSRFDGYLYKVAREFEQRQWGMYLGQSDDAGVVFDSSQDVGNENEHAAWELFKGYSLISTPAYFRDGIIAGSDEGIIYCIINV